MPHDAARYEKEPQGAGRSRGHRAGAGRGRAVGGQTITHITDETYRAPEARHGAGHVQYHVAREALITAGGFGAVVSGLVAGRRRSRATWCGMASAAAGSAAAMWSGGPTTGTWAPNRKALAVHAASTAGLTAGVWLLRPSHRR